MRISFAGRQGLFFLCVFSIFNYKYLRMSQKMSNFAYKIEKGHEAQIKNQLNSYNHGKNN